MVGGWRLSAAATGALLALLIAAGLIYPSEAAGAQLTASWTDNSNGTASTRLERRLGSDSVFVPLADVPPGVAMYVDGSVTSGTTYCYRAAAHGDTGISPYSNEACATVSADYTSVTVSKAGTGNGAVSSTPAGISCDPSCSASFIPGTVVTLSAVPAAGVAFSGWSGSGCAGTDPCTFASNDAVAVTATFSTVSYTLGVKATGPGSVSSNPSGIDCGSTCSASYAAGTLVTLTAAPTGNGTLSGWSGGGCSGTSPTCVVTLQSATSVSASFKGGKGK